MKLFLLTLFVAFVASAPVEDAQNGVEVIVNGLPEGHALEIGDIVDIKLKEHADGQVAATTNLLHPFSAVGIAEAAIAAEIEADAIQVVDINDNQVEPIQVIDVAEEISPIQVVDTVQPDGTPVQVAEAEDTPIQTLPILVETEAIPSPVVLPEPVNPEVVPEAVVLPEPAQPEVAPEPVVLPEPVAPEVVPSPVVVVPEPVIPDVVPEPVVLPEPVAPEVPVVPEALPVPENQFGEVYNDGNVQVTINAPEDAGILATLQSWVNVVMNYFNNGAQATHQIL